MTQSPPKNVVAHWHKLIEGFNTSAVEFYADVGRALARRAIPGLKTSHVRWHEGGILSPNREYLRVRGDRHVFDLCAAPFGTGFFFSSWVTRRRAHFVFPVFLLLLSGTAILSGMFLNTPARWAYYLGPLGFLLRAPWSWVAVPCTMFLMSLWVIAIAARGGNPEFELAVLAMPVIGRIYEFVFAPETYYRIDTTLMFQSAVHSATLEVIDNLTTEKGLRNLTDDERKPIFHKLM